MPLLEVTDARLVQLFVRLPATLHGAVPQYIGPLENEVEAVFDPAKNRRLATGEAIRWVFTDTDSGRVLGRVAAFLDRAAPDVQNPDMPTGGLGFFECVNDQGVANQLFDAARQWLARRGMQAMDGPINFGDRDRFWGLLIDGYERAPNYGMFWHPEYYKQLFEQYGFQLFFKQYTYYRTTTEPLHPRFAEQAAAHAADFRFDYARKSDPEKLARDFLHVYNLAWGRHAGVAAMTLAQAQALVREMRPVLDERLLWFAYRGHEPVAFFLSLPELNQIFRHVGSRLDLLGKMRFLWQQWLYQQRSDKRVFGLIYGVVPEYQGKGVDAAMLAHVRPAMEAAGYADSEMNWIGDFNPRMMVLTRSIGARVVKTHATYRYLFDRERKFERSPIIR